MHIAEGASVESNPGWLPPLKTKSPSESLQGRQQKFSGPREWTLRLTGEAAEKFWFGWRCAGVPIPRGFRGMGWSALALR
jgi:hypothetical protein